jgi:hypothetical protein
VETLIALLVLAACAACSSSGVAPEDQVTQEGRTLVRYEGAELQALISFRWADAHLGDEWLVLVAWLSGGRSATTVIDRNAITLRGPDSTRYPLLSQQAFREAYPEILSSLRSVDLSYPPGRGFAGDRRPCGRWFLAAPFEGFAHDTVASRPSISAPGRWCSWSRAASSPDPGCSRSTCRSRRSAFPSCSREWRRGSR